MRDALTGGTAVPVLSIANKVSTRNDKVRSDALTAATGRDVRVKRAGKRFRAEIAFDSPADAIELAERLLRRNPRS